MKNTEQQQIKKKYCRILIYIYLGGGLICNQKETKQLRRQPTKIKITQWKEKVLCTKKKTQVCELAFQSLTNTPTTYYYMKRVLR